MPSCSRRARKGAAQQDRKLLEIEDTTSLLHPNTMKKVWSHLTHTKASWVAEAPTPRQHMARCPNAPTPKEVSEEAEQGAELPYFSDCVQQSLPQREGVAVTRRSYPSPPGKQQRRPPGARALTPTQQQPLLPRAW